MHSDTLRRPGLTTSLHATFIWLLFTTAVYSASALSSTVYHSALDPQERLAVGEMANLQPWQLLRNAQSEPAHKLGVQTLSIELDERKKGDQRRRARVYQFNYDSQQSRLVLVDLQQGAVQKVQLIDTVHLPLNQAEIALARTLVEQNTDIMQRVNQIQRTRGLSDLNDLSNIEVKASIYEPDNNASTCAVQRCALISLFDQTRTVFAVEPLVNLQNLSVTTLQQSF